MAFGRRKKNRVLAEDELILIENVTKTYNTGAPALNGVSLTVKKGEFVFIVGDSGSGKSTLIKLLLRELTPSSGEIYVNGINLQALKHRQVPKYRRNLGVVFQDFRLLKDRNVYENVAFAQRIVQTPGRLIKRNVPAILSIVGLAGKYKAKPKELSGGEQQMCAIARGLMSGPKLILLDELSLGLMPSLVEKVFETVSLINRQGITVLIVEQMVQEALEIADRGYVIQTGKIVQSGSSEELLNSDEVKKAYLGM